jgi:hypothetical protein
MGIDKGKLIYLDRLAEKEAEQHWKRRRRVNLLSFIVLMFFSLSLLFMLVVSWLLGKTDFASMTVLFLLLVLVFSLCISDLISLKKLGMTVRIRIYEKGILFPTRKSTLHHYVETFIPFDTIKELYPNTNQDLDHLSLICQDDGRIALYKTFITDLDRFKRMLMGRVRIVENVDLKA